MEAMVDLLCPIPRDWEANSDIPCEALMLPDTILRDYSQNPILVGVQGGRIAQLLVCIVCVRCDIAPGAGSCLLGNNIVVPLSLMIPEKGVEVRDGPTAVTSHNAGVAPGPGCCQLGRGTSRCAASLTAEAQGCLSK